MFDTLLMENEFTKEIEECGTYMLTMDEAIFTITDALEDSSDDDKIPTLATSDKEDTKKAAKEKLIKSKKSSSKKGSSSKKPSTKVEISDSDRNDNISEEFFMNHPVYQVQERMKPVWKGWHIQRQRISVRQRFLVRACARLGNFVRAHYLLTTPYVNVKCWS